MNGSINLRQFETLMKPINGTRVATRTQASKQLSYLEAWDVRAHLIRVFGFGNFDVECIETEFLFEHPKKIGSGDNVRDGIEVAFRVTVRLTLRNDEGVEIAVYTESAVGGADGSTGFADLYDNALKTGASDALKRCAINLGSQFGLSLYDKGSRREIVKGVLVRPINDDLELLTAEQVAAAVGEWPEGTGFLVIPPDEAAGAGVSAEKIAAITATLGATEIGQEGAPAPSEEAQNAANQAVAGESDQAAEAEQAATPGDQ